MTNSEAEPINGKRVLEVTLGRSELERASKNGIEIDRRTLEEVDEIRIEVGPTLEMKTQDGLGKIVDASYVERAADRAEERVNDVE